jgi:hypothetical protein
MRGPTDEAIIPTKHVINGRVVGGTMRRKNGIRTMPVPAVVAAAVAAVAAALPPPPSEYAELPVAKKPRLQAPSTFSTVADRVTTDSPDDTRTVPVTPATPKPASHAPRRNWKGAEDTKLSEAVKKHGKDWPAVAKLVDGRTSLQCCRRWVRHLDPALEKSAGKWTPEEDAQLIEAVKKHGSCWVKVAALVPGRTDMSCRQRWVMTLNPDRASNTVEPVTPATPLPASYAPRRNWKGEEDAKLSKAVKNHGKDWVAVAAMVPGKTNDQCRQRWVRNLDPDRASNTVEEDPDRR